MKKSFAIVAAAAAPLILSAAGAMASEPQFQTAVANRGARIVEVRDLTGSTNEATVRAKQWSDGWNWSASVGNGHTTSAMALSTSSKGSPSSPHWSASIGTGEATAVRGDSTQRAQRATSVSASQAPGAHWTSRIGSARASEASTSAEKGRVQS